MTTAVSLVGEGMILRPLSRDEVCRLIAGLPKKRWRPLTSLTRWRHPRPLLTPESRGDSPSTNLWYRIELTDTGLVHRTGSNRAGCCHLVRVY